jgi:hypothetical protein
MARGGLLCCPRRASHVSPLGSSPHFACLGGTAVRGLLSWDAYVEWSEAELGNQFFLPCLCNADSLSQYKTIRRPTLKHSSYHYSNLSLQSFSIFSLSSHASQLTRHRLGTPLQRSLPFLVPFFLASGPAALPFHITYFEYLCATNTVKHVLLAFVRWQDAPSNESFSSFGGFGSAASLGVSTWLKDRIRGYPCSQNRPLDRGNTRDFKPVMEPTPYAWSA